MKQKNNEKRYDTKEKRIKFLKKKGNVLTFKEPFYPFGTARGSQNQILIYGIENPRSGEIKIIGPFYHTDWYKSMDELLDAIDWDRMEELHSFKL